MEFLIVVVPGFTLLCGFTMFALTGGQVRLFLKNKDNRSRDLALFCLFTGWFAMSQSMAHTRSLPLEVFKYYGEALFPVVFLCPIFYLKSMSYFIIVPRWLKRFFYSGQIILAVLSFLPIIHLIAYGDSIFFDETAKIDTGNFFMNSYTLRLGQAQMFPHIILSLSSALNILLATVILIRIQKSSRDIFLVFGLIFTIIASSTEMLLLPFTVKFFVPVLYLSNFFEAFRMNYLVFAEEVEPESKDEITEKYKESSIDEERLSRLAIQLQKLMNEKQLYREPELSLDKLAKELKVPNYLLTQTLRFGLNTNYFEYVNSCRVEDIKDKMTDPAYKDYNILDLAYSAGFKSKSSFNTAFKKVTNTTPSRYRKTLEVNSHVHPN